MIQDSYRAGCMVCSADLFYFETNQNKSCHYCEKIRPANAQCANKHFVCDQCHRADAVEIIKQVCLNSRETDAAILVQRIRAHLRFPVHGPEHHSLVPAVILTVLRNSGHDITDKQIVSGIERGRTIAGGACGFFGACGAAVGVGIAFSVLSKANPYTGDKRGAAMKVTQRVLGKIAAYNAPRCCQRECWIALQEASKLLEEKLGKGLKINDAIKCEQVAKNKECIQNQCPLWPNEAIC